MIRAVLFDLSGTLVTCYLEKRVEIVCRFIVLLISSVVQ